MFGGIPMNEIAALDAYWQTFGGLKALFAHNGTPYATLAVEDAKAIHGHEAVTAWQQNTPLPLLALPRFSARAYGQLGAQHRQTGIGHCQRHIPAA